MTKIIQKPSILMIPVFVLFLLFPIYFYYDSLVGLNIIPPIFGGYFTLMSIISLLPLFFTYKYLLDNKNIKIRLIDIIFFLIILLTTLISLINYSTGQPKSSYYNLFSWSMGGILFNLICYFLAKTLPIQSKKLKTIAIISLTLMILIVLYNIGDLGIFYLKDQSKNSEFVASYQGFARSMVVIGLLIVSTIKSKKITIPIFLLTLMALFFNGARTEFILFFFSYILLLFYTSINSRKKFTLTIVILALVTIIISVGFNNLIENLPDNRMMELLDIKSSNSGQERIGTTSVAIDTIINKPTFGDYGSYANNNNIGNYSHNLLSAWVNLGITGFALYVFAILIIIFGIFSRFSKNVSKNPIERVTFIFSVFTIMALILSKDYSYMLFGFMVGFFSRFEETINQKSVKETTTNE